jgi:hypothetical protein
MTGEHKLQLAGWGPRQSLDATRREDLARTGALVAADRLVRFPAEAVGFVFGERPAQRRAVA